MSIKPLVTGTIAFPCYRDILYSMSDQVSVEEHCRGLENMPASGKPISDFISRYLVTKLPLRPEPSQPGISAVDTAHVTWLLILLCMAVLFVNLGSADLF